MMSHWGIGSDYYDFDIIQSGEDYKTWGWAKLTPYDDSPRIKRIISQTTYPPIGIKAIPDNHESFIRLATVMYQQAYDAYGNAVSTQGAAGERAYWEFEVTEDNAIAILDYAAMLEYPTGLRS